MGVRLPFGKPRELKINALLTLGNDFMAYRLIGLSWEFRRTHIRMEGHRIVTFNGVDGRHDNPNYRHGVARSLGLPG